MTVLRTSLLVICTALVSRLLLNRFYYQRPSITTQHVNDTYDYIVVGAGSAGTVLASRLAEDKHVSVLIIESGDHYGDNRNFYEPSRWINVLGTQYDWAYLTEPQKHAFFGMKNNRGSWPRGHVFGGSGSINVLQYTRGSSFDYNEWEANGCTGWSFQDVLPYFLKTEDMQIEELIASKYHNTGGEIAVSSGDVPPLSQYFKNAGKELGYSITDYNGEVQDGFNSIQFNIRNGIRSSAAMEFFNTNKENVHIATKSHVTKVHLENKKAVGVYFIQDGRKRFVRCSKEIILSAGTINTPQILMLSGIGPKQHLEELGIPLVNNLPVGNNLQDHQQVSVCTTITKPYSLTQTKRENVWNTLIYKLFGIGPQAIAGSAGSAFLHLDKSTIGKHYPDIQLVLYASLIGTNIFNYDDNTAKEYLPQNPNDHGVCIFVALTHPRARGTIRLRSADPFDYPLIDPMYFSDRQDILDIIAGVRVWEQLMQTSAFNELGVDFNYMKMSFCAEHAFRSDSFWECIIRYLAFTQFHPTSSCKMGPVGDEDTVVDTDLRVKGITGLRVVDASIFPNITSGNTNAPTIMIAEKAADIIRGKDTVKHLRRSL